MVYRDDVDELVLMMILEMPNMVMVLVIRLHLIMPTVTASFELILASFLMILMMMHQFMNQDIGELRISSSSTSSSSSYSNVLMIPLNSYLLSASATLPSGAFVKYMSRHISRWETIAHDPRK